MVYGIDVIDGQRKSVVPFFHPVQSLIFLNGRQDISEGGGFVIR